MRISKAILKPVHTWVGIVAGVVLTVLALSGSIILFRAEFERAALPKAPSAKSSSRASLDVAAREALQFRPGSQIRRVRLAADPADPLIFQVESERNDNERIVVDAGSGQVLGVLETGWLDWMVDLHHNFLAGKQGRKAVGIAGIILFVLSATGVLLWLTGTPKWRAFVSVRRQGTARRFNFELHRAGGLWTYGFLALISFTGIELGFPDTFRGAVQSMTGKPATVKAPKNLKAESLASLDAFVRNGQSAMLDGIPMELRLPDKDKGAVELRLYRKGDLGPSENHVFLNPTTAAVVLVDRVVDRPMGAQVLAAFSPIHYGQFGGLPIKIAWALLGLAPLLLFVTGLIAWWRPAKKTVTPAVQEQEEMVLAAR